MQPMQTEPEVLAGAAQSIAGAAVELDDGLTSLTATVTSDNPWGADEPGTVFGAVYAQVLTHALDTYGSHVQQLLTAAENLAGVGSAGDREPTRRPRLRPWNSPRASQLGGSASACRSPRSSPNRSRWESGLDSGRRPNEELLFAAGAAVGAPRRPAPEPPAKAPTPPPTRVTQRRGSGTTACVPAVVDRDDGPRTRLLEDAIAARLIGSVLIIFAAMTLAMNIAFVVRLIVPAGPRSPSRFALPRSRPSARPTATVPASSPRPGSSAERLVKQIVKQVQTSSTDLEQAKKLLKLVRTGGAEARRPQGREADRG